MTGQGFKDHFSGHAADYARHRPAYPPELFAWLAAHGSGTTLAWDVGTGNGQAARGLAPWFERVVATDASAQQVARAEGPDNIDFAVEAAERSSLADESADLVTVSQALHWFAFDSFFAEVRRVLRPGGLFAAWTYQLNRVAPAVDRVVMRLYADVVGAFWPPERRHVDSGYASIPLPFKPIEAPEFTMQTKASLAGYRDYLGTWSAVRRFRQARGTDPLREVDRALADAWGDPAKIRTIQWPLVVRAGISSGRS